MKKFTIAIAAAVALLRMQATLSGASIDIRDLMTQAHNAVRRDVRVVNLTWSPELSAQAQRWADALILRNAFTPERDRQWGQNLFEIVGGTATPWEVVRSWASERASYDPATNRCSSRCGHYTQIVWRDTKYVGCATAHRGNREVWVCNYSPPGNILGERPY